jgi:NAD(P)H-nitrite reductase large subunit
MSARQMGMQAARSIVNQMTGEESELDFCFEMFAHTTKFLGHKVVLVGQYNGQKLDKQYEVLLRVTLGLEYVKTVMKDRKMQGALLMGETDLEETFGNLILN